MEGERLMPKEFYTEKDIEDMFKRGAMSLEINDNVVLTELAYEKARRMGIKLLREKPENPPSAPVRPYISQKQCRCAVAPAAAGTSPPLLADGPPAGAAAEKSTQQRIRDAVAARLGAQIDANLLDVIIKRVMASTVVK
jgi:hypothetical protein